jgi:hypothetical protein|uniref:RING-type domain-containing protein n=1 Tax=viral metagenome TaxID=1070528 RepID=A0A6C0BRH1_9ZZZZ
MACSICFNHIHEKYILKCNHVFHETCILKWTQIKNECPLCRCVIHLHDNAKLTQLINHINSISGFHIHKPDDQYMYILCKNKNYQALQSIRDHIEEYNMIRNKGFSDDHLATYIGILVQDVNKEIRNIILAN